MRREIYFLSFSPTMIVWNAECEMFHFVASKTCGRVSACLTELQNCRIAENQEAWGIAALHQSDTLHHSSFHSTIHNKVN